MTETNKHYIYLHTDSLGVPRYVGKGNNYKRGKNYSRSKYTLHRSNEWNRIFEQHPPFISILEEDLDDIEVNRKEHSWINYYGLIKDGGTLINIVNNLSFLTEKEKNRIYSNTKAQIAGRKRYREKHPEKIKASQKKWYIENRETILKDANVRARKWYKINLERHKETRVSTARIIKIK